MRTHVKISRFLADPTKVNLGRCNEILEAAGGLIKVEWADVELMKKVKNAKRTR